MISKAWRTFCAWIEFPFRSCNSQTNPLKITFRVNRWVSSAIIVIAQRKLFTTSHRLRKVHSKPSSVLHFSLSIAVAFLKKFCVKSLFKSFRLEQSLECCLISHTQRKWENYYEIFHSLSFETMVEWSELRDVKQIVASEAFIQSLFQFASLLALKRKKWNFN